VSEDVRLQALTYVIKLYDELTAENGAPTLGTQNQAVDFILANPERRRAVAEWATSINIKEASTAPPRRLPYTSFISRFTPISKRSWRQPHLDAVPSSCSTVETVRLVEETISPGGAQPVVQLDSYVRSQSSWSQ